MRPILRTISCLTSFRTFLVSVFLAIGVLGASAWAVEPFQLTDIRVEGLQRTEAGTVFASLPFRIGDNYTDEKGVAALRALFATGLFKDVRIQIAGSVVVVVVGPDTVNENAAAPPPRRRNSTLGGVLAQPIVAVPPVVP